MKSFVNGGDKCRNSIHFSLFCSIHQGGDLKTKRLSDIASSDVKCNKGMCILYAAFLLKGDVSKRSRRS